MAGRSNIHIENGWVSVYRSLASSPLWLSETFTKGQAWIDLLLLANHSEGFIRVRGNKVTLKRGQCGWSASKLAKRWDWSTGKVIRFLKELEEEKQIVIEASKPTTIITICNYSKYQCSTDSEQTKGGKKHLKTEIPELNIIISFFRSENSDENEAQKFFNYYTAKNWKSGESKILDWKSTARNWILRSKEFSKNGNVSKKSIQQNSQRHECDF